VAVDILDVHLFEPAGLHDAGDPDSIVAVAFVDLHLEHGLGVARVDANHRQASRLSSVHSHVDVGPVSSPMLLHPGPLTARKLKSPPDRNRRISRKSRFSDDSAAAMLCIADTKLCGRFSESRCDPSRRCEKRTGGL